MANPSKFVPQSYERNDELGKRIVAEFLRSRGLVVPIKDEDYKADLIAYRGDVATNVEVEMKNTFFNDKNSFPFSTVSFLARKKKYGDFWYVIVSKKGKGLLMCHSDEIYKDEYQESINVNTSERSGVDKFYRVPKDKIKWFKYER